MWGADGFMWGGMMGGGLMMILFWGGLIVLVVLGGQALFKQSGNSRNLSSGNAKSALDILKERYARGEIGQEEYFDMRRNLLS